MKLKEYVQAYANLFNKFNPTELHNYIVYVRDNEDYHTLENRILWDMYRRVNHYTEFSLYDEIRAKYPDVKDAHTLTMLKAAFKQAFGCDVNTFITRH